MSQPNNVGNVVDEIAKDLRQSAVLSQSFVDKMIQHLNHVARLAYENGMAEGREKGRADALFGEKAPEVKAEEKASLKPQAAPELGALDIATSKAITMAAKASCKACSGVIKAGTKAVWVRSKQGDGRTSAMLHEDCAIKAGAKLVKAP